MLQNWAGLRERMNGNINRRNKLPTAAYRRLKITDNIARQIWACHASFRLDIPTSLIIPAVSAPPFTRYKFGCCALFYGRRDPN